MRNKISGLFSLTFLAFGLIAKPVWAFTIEDLGPQTGLAATELKPLLINAISFVLGLIGLISVIMVIYGGAVWLTASGNEDRLEHAKKIISGAVVGVFLVLTSWALFSTVLKGVVQVTG
ncbi:hypothetical protein C4546_04675 [Candidatus Parcubacteria bacterium]|jgi:hypothetical protein|nr:MAG: hypothetical protein C4546_04675 [Candidatus Parcubacteria bacterium]